MTISTSTRNHRHLAAALTLTLCSLAAAAQVPPASPNGPAAKPSAAIPLSGPGSTLPASAPTALPARVETPGQQPAQKADILYTDGLLTVNANNSSLNQILRSVAHVASIKVTGGVADQRVYGHYGPAAPEDILAQLLDGTGMNILIIDAVPPDKSELVLTPRQGGPTPPNLSPYTPDDDSDTRPPQTLPPPRRPQQVPQPPAQQAPAQSSAQPVAVQPLATPATSTAAPPTSVQSPNGVATPEQIFNQLQQLQKNKPVATPPQ